jgi:predicted phosphate transport protein (TIGR00153 family)
MKLTLIPKTTEFYDLFASAGRVAHEAARLTEIRFREIPDTTVPHARVKELETEGDAITRQIFELLNTQYVTPFDREDIYDLARAVDDVVDFVDEASDLLDIYKIDAPMDQAVAQCRVLVEATAELERALGSLRSLNGVRDSIVEIKRLEDEGDRIARDAIASLFEDEDVSPRTMIRWKDVFEALERAIDGCETAAHAVGNIAVKNA